MDAPPGYTWATPVILSHEPLQYSSRHLANDYIKASKGKAIMNALPEAIAQEVKAAFAQEVKAAQEVEASAEANAEGPPQAPARPARRGARG